MAVYDFESIARFQNREDGLAALGTWFDKADERRALGIFGRRRVGKSWLFRAFAHGREADIFVATTRDLADQLATFATRGLYSRVLYYDIKTLPRLPADARTLPRTAGQEAERRADDADERRGVGRRRTVGSPPAKPCSSRRRCQIRRAVWRCLR